MSRANPRPGGPIVTKPFMLPSRSTAVLLTLLAALPSAARPHDGVDDADDVAIREEARSTVE